jgi:hypothetical protein
MKTQLQTISQFHLVPLFLDGSRRDVDVPHFHQDDAQGDYKNKTEGEEGAE